MPNPSDALTTLRRQYYALVPPYLLQIPPPAALASPGAQARLVGLLDGLQPEPGYARGFWRRVLPVVEDGVRARSEAGDEDAEVDERVYEAVADLMVGGDGPSSLPKQSFKTFIYDSDSDGAGAERRITLLEEQIAIQAGTTGLRTWTARLVGITRPSVPSAGEARSLQAMTQRHSIDPTGALTRSLHLGHHVVHSPNLLFASARGREWPNIVELGAGTGFLSILLAQQGADVVASDLGDDGAGHDADDVSDDSGDGADADRPVCADDRACAGTWRTPLGRLRANVRRNGVDVVVRELDWGDALRPPADRPAVWAQLAQEKRTVVAADVIYDPELVPLLVAAIDALLPADGHALVAATIRNAATFELFLATCASSDLHTVTIDVPPVDPANPTFWDTALDKASAVVVVRVTRAAQ
ncbi:hypothetical protein Q5752_003576 [Cryptotrichosporon argae]